MQVEWRGNLAYPATTLNPEAWNRGGQDCLADLRMVVDWCLSSQVSILEERRRWIRTVVWAFD